jgi:hypothetical protein
MSYEVKSKTLPGGHRVAVEHDPDPYNPRKKFDRLGTVLLVDSWRYNFGDDTASVEELREIYNDPDNIALPIYAYEHGGITINTTGFSCGWDSGQVGIVYMTKAQAVENWGKKIVTAKVREAAIKCLEAEIEELDNYLTGQVYGYCVYNPEGEEVESCWGFFGDSDYCLGEGVSVAESLEAKAEKNKRAAWRAALHEARQVRYWAARDVVTTGAHA